ncbi:GNAT family N-acetyltransferase [Streptomyces orinoci]|uniref:GNAT family N-acetyltransferase n=1 Tax=Streptomyces orinoci TaxID=67339 RepID=A0ABV3K6U1_STRON|nr:GNAT family N-acetyltransferase [Streptomyces orinoci]
MRIVPVGYDHPDAKSLDGQAQQEYLARYGAIDLTAMDPAEFSPPRGLYLIAYTPDGSPVATGGWRAQDLNEEGYADGDAEIKRMFTVEAARGRGLARRILGMLEESARAAGRLRMVLETGLKQPEAVALYLSVGYAPAPKFGLYRHEPYSQCFAKPLT